MLSFWPIAAAPSVALHAVCRLPQGTRRDPHKLQHSSSSQHHLVVRPPLISTGVSLATCRHIIPALSSVTSTPHRNAPIDNSNHVRTTQREPPQVQAFVLDTFGTGAPVSRGSSAHGSRASSMTARVPRPAALPAPLTAHVSDWDVFTAERRKGYHEMISILDRMLASPRWAHLATDAQRHELVLFWHDIPGTPPPPRADDQPADRTHRLGRHHRGPVRAQEARDHWPALISNGNVRTLVDMAKNGDLPWDVILSSELLGSYKPNPKMYLGALQHLSLAPHQCAMVAAHIYDLRAAASHGMRTVFVRRPQEPDAPDDVRGKSDGGEVDVYAKSFWEVARVLEAARREEQEDAERARSAGRQESARELRASL
ncbi:HAD-like protein [Wolfiporia cocos MD-104 SS10]|uniref:HAD-like protein n=1 Tax=Wolfiporia cocos (strain MD-104) TaxID=742152 RepID=A0A2H3ITG2_WOLCO|nr:HAD-like protein [Wolfiporia cocos MD-104 SS10]